MGKKWSEESKRRLSEVAKQQVLNNPNRGMRNKNHSEAAKRKIGEANSKKKRTEAEKKAISEFHKGKIISQEVRDKISNTMKGVKKSDKTRAKMRGRKLSLVTIQKIRKALLGRSCSEETKSKIREKLLGRTLSEETKRKISLSGKGKKKGKMSDETKYRLREVNLGKHLSEITKRKISEKLKGRSSWNKGKKTPNSTKDKIRNALILAIDRGRFPIKRSKVEIYFGDKIENLFGVKLEHTFRLKNRYFDYRYKNFLFETDGSFWHRLDETKIRDDYKTRIAEDSGYVLFRFTLDTQKEVNKLFEEKRLLFDSIFKEGGWEQFVSRMKEGLNLKKEKQNEKRSKD